MPPVPYSSIPIHGILVLTFERPSLSFHSLSLSLSLLLPLPHYTSFSIISRSLASLSDSFAGARKPARTLRPISMYRGSSAVVLHGFSNPDNRLGATCSGAAAGEDAKLQLATLLLDHSVCCLPCLLVQGCAKPWRRDRDHIGSEQEIIRRGRG